MKNFIYLILIATLISSCAISRKIPYNNLKLELPQLTTKSISIAVWDQREQVLNGSRKPDFVGYLRSVAGIAYPLGTASGKAFADDIALDISTSFQNNGCKAIVVPTSYKDNENIILNNLKESNNDKLILVKCNELHTDGYADQGLFFKLQVSIYRANGTLIGQKSFNGAKPLGKGMKFETYLPKGLEELIKEVFNDPTVNSALNDISSEQ